MDGKLERSVLLRVALVAGDVFQRAGDQPDERPVVALTAVPLVQREGDAKSSGESLQVLNLGPTKTRCV
jgi:hypothetical protein